MEGEDDNLMSNEYYNNNEKDSKTKFRQKLKIASIFSIITEIISIICSFSYANKYDESDSGLSKASAILLLVGLLGRTVGFVVVQLLASKVEDWNCKDPNDPQGHNLCIKYLMILSLPFVGPLQLLATIFMMVSNTENDATNVKVFGAFIIIMDFITVILAIVYGITVLIGIFCPCDKEEQEPANL